MNLTTRDKVNIRCFLYALCYGFIASILRAYHFMHGEERSNKYLTDILHGTIDKAMRNCPSELIQPFVFYDEEFAVVILPLLQDTVECRLEWTERMGTQYVTNGDHEETGKPEQDLGALPISPVKED